MRLDESRIAVHLFEDVVKGGFELFSGTSLSRLSRERSEASGSSTFDSNTGNDPDFLSVEPYGFLLSGASLGS
jgi:hypothetical protein